MQFGAVGDLHGDFDALDRILARHPDVAFWVCPGDLASERGEYPRPQRPLYWIKGNNEDFEFVVMQPAGAGTIPNLSYVPNGLSVQAPGGISIAGLGGTFAPTWYDKPAADLPPDRTGRAKKDDKRRHFVKEEVEACKRLKGVDIFLSHEAPRPFMVETRQKTGTTRAIDAGKTPINEVLAAMQPRLHLFGHHHRYVVSERQTVPSIGLEMAADSYLIFDGKSLAHHRMTT